MENLRNIDLVNDPRKSKKLVASPAFICSKIFTENLVGIERIKSTLTLNKPIYAGFTILELSKVHMYNFHCNHIKHTYFDKVRLLFTDTDSLSYEIETPNIYDDIATSL